ncbi:MAG: polysaccharide biosynthesis/export family protein [Syntrophales bacterium]
MKKKTVMLAVIALFLVSCGPAVKYSSAPTLPEIRSPSYPVAQYTIQTGDVLDIKFYYNPELNEQITVRPDGRISLQLAPEVMAAGLTPSALSGILNEKYGTELREPKVTVIVRSFGTQKIHVGGEVNRPGLINLAAPMTIIQSLSEAGWLKETARTNEVVVIRKDEKKKPLIFTVDLDKALDGTDLSQNVLLMPYDIVYVPRSPIADVNLWVDQYIRRNIPVPFGFGVGWTLNE